LIKLLSKNIILLWRMVWVGDRARMGEMRSACVILFGRVMCRWKKNIKLELKDIGYKGPHQIFCRRVGTGGELI
jgi:hypothetical protein